MKVAADSEFKMCLKLTEKHITVRNSVIVNLSKLFLYFHYFAE